MNVGSAVRIRAARLKTECIALHLAAKHPQTPWYARLIVGLVVAYALSPIDLIPDFIPVLGLLDDLILLPAGISLAIKLIPPAVMEQSRAEARTYRLPGSWSARLAAALILVLWAVPVVLGILWTVRHV